MRGSDIGIATDDAPGEVRIEEAERNAYYGALR
jgi:hypothetical protein